MKSRKPGVSPPHIDHAWFELVIVGRCRQHAEIAIRAGKRDHFDIPDSSSRSGDTRSMNFVRHFPH
jgi:hypothetical protein